MKKSKIVLPILAIACTLTLSACDSMQTLKPSNSPFYEDNNTVSPTPSDLMPSLLPSISPDLEPNNSPGNNPPDLIPNPTENENPNDNLK